MHVVACNAGMTGGDLPSSCAGSVPTHDSYTQISSQLCSQCCTDKSYTAVSVSRAIQGVVVCLTIRKKQELMTKY